MFSFLNFLFLPTQQDCVLPVACRKLVVCDKIGLGDLGLYCSEFMLGMRTCLPCHIPDRWSRNANRIWPDLAFGFVHKRSGNEIISRHLLVDNLVNIFNITNIVSTIIIYIFSYKIMIYSMFLTIYTGPHKLAALIFIMLNFK